MTYTSCTYAIKLFQGYCPLTQFSSMRIVSINIYTQLYFFIFQLCCRHNDSKDYKFILFYFSNLQMSNKAEFMLQDDSF